MAQPTETAIEPAYDPRWFIWTIVFLVVVGVSLTTYIVTTSDTSADYSGVVVHSQKPVAHQTPTTTGNE